MTARYNVTRIVNTCVASPSQWEGELDTGQGVYVRYRHGVLVVEVDGESIFRLAREGHGLDGYLTYRELKALSPEWIEWPEEES